MGIDDLFGSMFDLIQTLGLLPALAWLNIDLTMPQFRVVMLLLAEEALTITTVAQRLQVTPPTASGIVDRLVRHGFAEREDDPNDRRIVRIRLTGQGKDAVKALFHPDMSRISNAILSLSPEERQALERGLRAIRGALLSATEDEQPLNSHRQLRGSLEAIV